MNKRRLRKHAFILTTALVAFFMVAPSAFSLSDGLEVHATSSEPSVGMNQVYFTSPRYETDDSNIVYATLRFEGKENSTIKATYQTYSGTAIEGLDYQGITNSVSITIPAGNNVAEYSIAIKCLNDASSRETIRVYEGDQFYGRYFNLELIAASNASIGSQKACKCYLSYDFKAEATTGASALTSAREVAYLNDYKTMIMKYNSGKELDGQEYYKTWKYGTSFNNETTRSWLNTYIQKGLAEAYGSFVVKDIDDMHGFMRSRDGDVDVCAGNGEFIERFDEYPRSKDCPGQYLLMRVDPPGNTIDGTAMYHIARWVNPYKKDDDWVDVSIKCVGEQHAEISWIVDQSTWFSSPGTVYTNTFYKIAPYNGALDMGVVGFDCNGENNMDFKKIWSMMTLYDHTAPQITKEYCEFDARGDNGNGALRIYLRYNEPVYASRKYGLLVKVNNYSHEFQAKYVEGNYSDTLVYEVPYTAAIMGQTSISNLNEKITSVTYQLPNDDIGDMAYNMNPYKEISHNMAGGTDTWRSLSLGGDGIDLAKPKLNVDLPSSSTAQNVYNIILSANDNGNSDFNSGIVYYKIDTEAGNVLSPSDPSSYDNTHVLTSEEQGSFTVTLAKNGSPSLESGVYYIHALAVSNYGFSQYDTFGPYKLDVDEPVVVQTEPTANELQYKEYRFKVADKPLGTSISNISMVAKYSAGEKEEVKRLTLFENDAIPSSLTGIVSSVYGDGQTIYTYRSNLDSGSDVPIDEFISGIMGEEARLNIEVYFEVTDIASNKGKSNSIRTVYDVRTLFENPFTAPDSYVEKNDIPVGCKVYDISGAKEGEGVTFTVAEADPISYITGGCTYSLEVNGKIYQAPAGQHSLTLKDLEPGYYQVTGFIKGIYSETEIDMVSKTAYFYLTDNFGDETANHTSVEGNLVLTNHVYQLTDAQFYFYDTAKSAVGSHPYGATYNPDNMKYEGGSTSPTFSSTIEAKKYIKYMEYQDLHLVEITDAIASLLNSGAGSTIYVKADGETTLAQAGQLWVRYKRASWTSSLDTNGWVFYYYGSGKASDGININGLSTNLNAAIEAITNRIVSGGKDMYLVEEDNLNSVTYAPYLAANQMHVELETASSTKSGDPYISAPTYNGDPNLYQNNVKIGEDEYPIATNIPLSVSENTLLYYRYFETDQWAQLSIEDGALLKSALSANITGPYTIREYDDHGVSEFNVYVDNTLPTLNAIVNSGLDGEYPVALDGSILSFSCTNLALQSFSSEADSLAYVAIYSYPNRALKTVLYGDDLKKNGYLLSEGNFYVQVGDRSGNIATYTVLTSASRIDVSVAENQTQTAIIVKVNNREEAEIYSYEVYLNEVLIDNEFAPSKTYREAGLYRVQITDIYGNTETITIAHENPSPELTWYYLNDNGGYSVYDPNKPVRMVLKDSTTIARTTDVYASTLVRVIISSVYDNDDTAFEITGIEPGDYSYNELTGLLSINTLQSWTLKVWYTQQANSEHTYIFTLDNTSPQVNGSFIGTPHECVVRYDQEGKIIYTSCIDELDFDSYEVGDIVTLDGLEFATSASREILFGDGAILSARRVVISVSDQSGIRSVTATRNGNPIEVELNQNNQLILNSDGDYVITVTDNLSNITLFKFNNVGEETASGKIDGNSVKAAGGEESANAYGNDALEVVGLYNGNAWVTVNDGQDKATYVFSYDGKTLTYGQYVIVEDIYIDGEGVEQRKEIASFQPNGNFALYSDDSLSTIGKWFNVIESDHYALQVMIDETKLAHYKVACIDEEIRAEISYNVGKVHLPNRYVATLSKEEPSITLLSAGKPVEIKEGSEFIYIADDLTIDTESVSQNIAKIEFSYAELPTFESFTPIYEEGEWREEFIGKDEGFYRFIVTNKYGSQRIYTVSKIQTFVSVVTIHTLDGSEVTYTGNEGTIYANYSIDLIVYSDSVYFEVNGKISSGYNEGGVATLSLTRDGKYEVAVIGENGVREDFSFEIKADESFLYDESWIVGYNEKALLRDRGYTNQMCSIVLGEDVVFVDMVVNDEDYYALYDNITDDKRTDLSLLNNAIGRYGVGKYTVGFRNKYGDLVTKTVYYNNVPSLTLQRITTANPGIYQTYELADATNYGFYSNYVLVFSTSSETYEFKINDVAYRLDQPKRLEFTNATGIGSFAYTVTYLDEYGNYLEFDAVLYRAEVEFDATTMSTITLNGSLYTKDDIVVTFAEGLKATVSVDGEEAVDYPSGKPYRADGEYTFVVRDVAGNTATYVIRHKSVNHYTLVNNANDEEVQGGGVVNNGRVVFTASDDSHIKYVVKNGELVSDYNSVTFSTSGHFELLIEDSIGNQSYEEFYIVNNSLCEFNYAAPYGYEITEVWRINENGSRELMNYRGPSMLLNEKGDYLVVVTSKATTSSFNFSVTIDRTLPSCELSGASDGQVTASDVTLTGLRSGDVVKVYRDGELLSVTEISLSSDAPKITQSGKYRVQVTNVQGMTVEYTFTRKAITNVAGSIFIFVSCGLIVIGVGIGLIYHTKLKTDD